MTAGTPSGAVARPPLDDHTAEWQVPTGTGARLTLRVRRGRGEILTGPAATPLTFTDPAELRAFLWTALRTGMALADVMQAGRPEPAPDPQLTIDDALAEVTP